MPSYSMVTEAQCEFVVRSQGNQNSVISRVLFQWWTQVTLLQRTPRLIPPSGHQVSKDSLEEKKSIPSSWKSHNWDQIIIELVFVTPSKAISASASSSSSSEVTSLSNTAFLDLIPYSFDVECGMGNDAWFHGGCWFFIPWSVFSQTLELHFLPPSPLPTVSPLPTPPSPQKPREIDKQQDRGNWAILFLLWEAHFAAFIWKLSFSTSLGMHSHRPMTPKCLCWSIVPVSYWHAHWQPSLSTGPGPGSQLQSVWAAWKAGKACADIDTANGDGLLSTQGRCIC